jgi:Protein of unknown function (DUF1566)
MNRPARLVASTILGIGILAGARANAQVFENGPYYANPSWDQQIPAAQRFIVLSNWNNDAVLDRETGLVWQRTPSNSAGTWGTALEDCHVNFQDGRRGWRLPSIEELSSLVDNTGGLPAGSPFIGVNTGMVGNVFATYWSSTTDERSSGADAYSYSFGGGLVDIAPKANSNFVWCVRGGSGPQNPQ